jgi:hypothetical protein
MTKKDYDLIAPKGYFIMGQHTSVAWYKDKAEADKECKRMNYRGGTIYIVVAIK